MFKQLFWHPTRPSYPDAFVGRTAPGSTAIDMPLQNRVSPFGEIVATPERGGLMGNRGILHDTDRRLGVSRWKHPHWVCCRLAFRGRHRPVMTPGRYTELFFLDEATALAAGHRPCAECRRADYTRFRDAWTAAHGARPSAPTLDRRLHPERVTRRWDQVRFEAPLRQLPQGVMVVLPADETTPWLVWAGRLWRWSFGGYLDSQTLDPRSTVRVLTPRPTVEALAAGYRPSIDASVDA